MKCCAVCVRSWSNSVFRNSSWEERGDEKNTLNTFQPHTPHPPTRESSLPLSCFLWKFRSLDACLLLECLFDHRFLSLLDNLLRRFPLYDNHNFVTVLCINELILTKSELHFTQLKRFTSNVCMWCWLYY